jgi:hypothetical protein
MKMLFMCITEFLLIIQKCQPTQAGFAGRAGHSVRAVPYFLIQ